jgi:hypothetical protein
LGQKIHQIVIEFLGPHSYVLAIIFLSSLKMYHQLSQNLSRDAHHFGSIKKLKKLKTFGDFA